MKTKGGFFTNLALSAVLLSSSVAAVAEAPSKGGSVCCESDCNSCFKRLVKATKVITDRLLVKQKAKFCDDVKIKGDLCLEGVIKPFKDTDEAMSLLFDAFIAVDEGFNGPQGGLTPAEIVALGYFTDNPQSTILLAGPFIPDICGHTNHSLIPGTSQVFGAQECAEAQANFEGALLNDPRFPFNVQGFDSPKIFHSLPLVSTVITNRLVQVNALADVRYEGQGVESDENSPIVARVESTAMYQLQCDEFGDQKIPVIVWINFTLTYLDCELP